MLCHSSLTDNFFVRSYCTPKITIVEQCSCYISSPITIHWLRFYSTRYVFSLLLICTLHSVVYFSTSVKMQFFSINIGRFLYKYMISYPHSRMQHHPKLLPVMIPRQLTTSWWRVVAMYWVVTCLGIIYAKMVSRVDIYILQVVLDSGVSGISGSFRLY